MYRLDNFIENTCDGRREILEEIISFIIEPDRLLFLSPPSIFKKTRKQIIMKPNDVITIKFVLNKGVEVSGVKIFDIDPKGKKHWRVAEIFGIPIEKAEDKTANKFCTMYNLRNNAPNKRTGEAIKKQRRCSLPVGVAAQSEDIISELHKQLKHTLHEHRDSDTSIGLFWRKPVMLMANTLYCVRIKLTAWKESKVFVTRWYPNKFGDKPIYNYRYGLFRSLQYSMPQKMDFIPQIAIMTNN